ncbi:hypothetical protein K443DRAFT_261072 [Laccaria amethystina LaAM-08-1]|uniref:Uncharacterized protein n=1 Tax=Laccaria amethystina LaAM-08-1 TaxID=1095629 RepID=A0A0C9XH80_9AGAR|nr:hypothetical protein K443DRAFT_261072 [Laccaria amethystina LaAM-08-1]
MWCERGVRVLCIPCGLCGWAPFASRGLGAARSPSLPTFDGNETRTFGGNETSRNHCNNVNM